MRRGVGTSIVIALLVACTAATSTAAVAKPRVTVIGDSVLTAVLWNETPRAALEQGFDMQLDIGVCRTITRVSCEYEGGRVPTLVDAVRSLGRELAPTVVVEVGYNDPQDSFAADVEEAVQALLTGGAKHILWASLRGSSQHIDAMNAVLDAAAARHPQLRIVDWNRFAGEHWSWFQSDGVHLFYDGAMAFATFLNDALVTVLYPLAIDTPRLPAARAGRAYTARLAAHGGTAPYRWSIVGGRLGKGLHLLADGRIVGRPARRGRIGVVVQATDAKGRAATRLEVLSVSPS